MTLCDDSGYDIRCTFWGELALRDDAFWEAQPVLAAKGMRVSDYGGVSLGSGFSSQLLWDSTDEPRSAALRKWWDQDGGREASTTALTNGAGGGGGGGASAVPFAERIALDDIKGRQLGYGEKPDYVVVAATLNFVRTEKMWYEACAQDGCQKKVVQNTDGSWHCEKRAGRAVFFRTFERRRDRRTSLDAAAAAPRLVASDESPRRGRGGAAIRPRSFRVAATSTVARAQVQLDDAGLRAALHHVGDVHRRQRPGVDFGLQRHGPPDVWQRDRAAAAPKPRPFVLALL